MTGNVDLDASMEPWHFSHGEGYPKLRLKLTLKLLQWSHGILAMESSRGIRDLWATVETLQWSHGILAMES